ncbi:MAG: Crp/Fnr family transcriptional regulator, partial [Candidatus Tectomicrobia bacterium]|nr:Crp/Fnr family transcriptional regulator [Candidatus Tectomicrobia bacterium]
PGTIFGEMSMIGQGMYQAFAEAMEDATICVVRRQNMVQFLSTRPAVALRLLEIVGQRFLEAQASLEALAFKNVRARLASLLLRLAKQQAGNVVEGVSHQDLAEMVATLRETITDTLNHFKEEGMVELGRRHIIITDFQKLKAIAEG